LEQVVVHKDTGEVRRTLSYALTSLGPEVADAKRLGELLVARWEIENGSFWVRDVLLRAASPLREHRKAFSFRPLSALRFLGLYAV